jgi:hypothetical protein
MTKKLKYICASCGSENVVWDAWANWDFEKQQTVLENSFDQAFCCDCDGDCKTIEVEVEIEEKPVPAKRERKDFTYRPDLNGFQNWIETYFEIVSHLATTCDNSGSIANTKREEGGQGRVYEIAEKLTDEFEIRYHENYNERFDTDGYLDSIDLFLKEKETEHFNEIHERYENKTGNVKRNHK